jgi:hypothetical protein
LRQELGGTESPWHTLHTFLHISSWCVRPSWGKYQRVGHNPQTSKAKGEGLEHSLNQWIEKRKILKNERLSKIKKKPAYDKAKFLWPTSVTHPIFCLHFLRAADSNPRQAARLLLDSLPSVDVDGGKLGLADMMLWLEKRKRELHTADPIEFSSFDDTDVIYFPSVNDKAALLIRIFQGTSILSHLSNCKRALIMMLVPTD